MPAGESLVAGDESCAAGEHEVIPDPLGEDRNAVAESDEKEDVYDHPCKPGGKSAEMSLERPLHFGHGSHAADGRHVALVEIAKNGAALPGEVGCDDFADIIAHLHGGLRDARNLLAVLFEVGEVAEDEDFGEAGRIEIAVDDDAAAFVGRRTKRLAKGRSLNAGCP